MGEEAGAEIQARNELKQREVTNWEAVTEAEHLVENFYCLLQGMEISSL